MLWNPSDLRWFINLTPSSQYDGWFMLYIHWKQMCQWSQLWNTSTHPVVQCTSQLLHHFLFFVINYCQVAHPLNCYAVTYIKVLMLRQNLFQADRLLDGFIQIGTIRFRGYSNFELHKNSRSLYCLFSLPVGLFGTVSPKQLIDELIYLAPLSCSSSTLNPLPEIEQSFALKLDNLLM